MFEATEIPIHALFDESGINPNESSDPRDLLEAADVILACDVMTDGQGVMYGREFLNQIAESGEDAPGTVMRVSLDFDTDELEQLCALVGVVKGSHDWE